jgi:hypothetical protein
MHEWWKALDAPLLFVGFSFADGDVDFVGREITVARALSDDGRRVDTPKTGDTRVVDMSQQLSATLRAPRDRATSYGALQWRHGRPTPVALRRAKRRAARFPQCPSGVRARLEARQAAGALHASLSPSHVRVDPHRRREVACVRAGPARAQEHHDDRRYLPGSGCRRATRPQSTASMTGAHWQTRIPALDVPSVLSQVVTENIPLVQRLRRVVTKW